MENGRNEKWSPFGWDIVEEKWCFSRGKPSSIGEKK
jgi:hypothetical protein